MADAVVELTFDRPEFILRTVSRVETFTLDLISAYAVKPCERWEKDIVGRGYAVNGRLCKQENAEGTLRSPLVPRYVE